MPESVPRNGTRLSRNGTRTAAVSLETRARARRTRHGETHGEGMLRQDAGQAGLPHRVGGPALSEGTPRPAR